MKHIPENKRHLMFWICVLVLCCWSAVTANADVFTGTYSGSIYRLEQLINIQQFEMTFFEDGNVTWGIVSDGWFFYDPNDPMTHFFPPVSGGTGTYSYDSALGQLTFDLGWTGNFAANDDSNYHMTKLRLVSDAPFVFYSEESTIIGSLHFYTDGYYTGGDSWENSDAGSAQVAFLEQQSRTPSPTATPTGVAGPQVITVTGTIQEAIDAASVAVTVIIVPAGTYVENLDLKGKSLFIQSEDPSDSDIVAATIIDGNGQAPVVTVSGTTDSYCSISGLTITNGKGIEGAGGVYGGEYWTQPGNVSIIDCVIANNEGGGISGCEGSIVNNTIRDNYGEMIGGVGYCSSYIGENHFIGNEASQGGAIYEFIGAIANNKFEKNKATGGDFAFGGAIAACFDETAILGNTFYENSAIKGGALYECSGYIAENIFIGNQATGTEAFGGAVAYCNNSLFINNIFTRNNTSGDGGAIANSMGTFVNNTIYGNNAAGKGGGMFGCNMDGTKIENSIIWGNYASDGRNLKECVDTKYCCIWESWPGTGNINGYPSFADVANDDFSLLKDSPCIDAGGANIMVYQDFAQKSRPINGSDEARGDGSDYDIGAYEFDPYEVRSTFEMVSLSRNVLYEEGRPIRIQFAVNPKGDFNSQVKFALPYYQNEIQHRFIPSEVTPPAVVTLIADLSAAELWAGQNEMTVEAVAEGVDSETKYLELNFLVPDTTSGLPSLYIDSSQFRIRLGGFTTIDGRLYPPMASETITLNISRIEINSSKKVALTATAVTDADGKFQYRFFPETTGDYQITGSWSGSPTFGPINSDSTYVQVIPKSSQISMQVKSPSPFVAGESLACSGRISPAPLREATAEILVWYNYESEGSSPIVGTTASVKGGVFSGEFLARTEGVAKLSARWYGDSETLNGSESPPMYIQIDPASSTSSDISTAAISSDPGHAIIIAAGTSDNLSAEVRDYLTNFNYSVLNKRRFSDARLLYINDNGTQDVDWDGVNDPGVVDIVKSSPEAISQALDIVKTDTNPVSLFIVGEKGQGATIAMGDGTDLSATDLDTVLKSAVGSQRDLRIVVEASNSGDFCEALAAPNRTIISSASQEQASYFSNGLLSFSQLYMTNIQAGWGVKESFLRADDYLKAALGFFGVQTPMLIEGDDYNAQYMSFGLSSDADDMLAPEISAINESIVLQEAATMDVFAYAYDDSGIYSVEASLVKPDGTNSSIKLIEDETELGKYAATVDKENFSQLGVYTLTFQALDLARNSSTPKSSQIMKMTTYDLNNDSKVDAKDLCILIEEMSKGDSLYNIAGSQVLNYIDLYAFMTQWNP